MKIGISSLNDFMSFLIRRRWWVIVPFIALSCVVAILTRALPKVFVSETLVVAVPRDVPENFVMDLTSNNTEQRLKTIQQMVRSRKNLISVLSDYRDKLPELNALNPDEAVERLRKQIDIRFHAERDARGATNVIAFNIAFQHKDAKMAQAIAERLTKLFIDEDRTARETHVDGTTNFLRDELNKKEADLEASENKLKLLKGGHLYELPERLDGNQRDLDRFNDDKRSNAEALDRIASTKLNYEQTMAQVPEFLPSPPRAAAQQALKEKNPELDVYLKAKADWEHERVGRPSEEHPSVLQAKARMDRAKQRVPADVLEAALNPAPDQPGIEAEEKRRNPTYTQLQNAMRDLATEYNIRLAQRKNIEESIARVSGRVNRTPQVELLLTEATRENADLRKQRDELYHDLNKAELSRSLETTAHGAQFTLVDPANLPVDAEKPNKGVVLVVGCLLSLALSIGFAFVVDLSRQRVWTQSEIETFWGVPVMVDIPAIVSDSDQAVLRKKRMAFATLLFAGFAVYSVFLYGVHLKNNYILQQLDPVLQKLVYRQ